MTRSQHKLLSPSLPSDAPLAPIGDPEGEAPGLDAAIASRDEQILDLDHRSSSTLRTIMTLMRLHMDRLPTQRAKDAFGDLQARIHALTLITEELGKDGAGPAVNFSTQLQQLCERMAGVYRGTLELTLDPGSGNCVLPRDAASRLSRVIDEIVCNAFNRALQSRRSDSVHVELRVVGDVHLLTVTDKDGHPPRAMKPAASALIKRHVASLGGTIHTDAPADGTLFRMSFPRA
jgi:two-component sensor histidine kinase